MLLVLACTAAKYGIDEHKRGFAQRHRCMVATFLWFDNTIPLAQ